MKRIILLFLAASLALSFVGCGAASSTASSNSTASSTAQEQADSSSAAASEEYYQDAALDYTGRYMDGNDEDADVIEITKTDDTSYDFTVSIYRLCEMTGTGSIMDGALEVTLTDPNGNEMTAIFYPEDEYSYAFKVTTSTWDYLEEGTEFTGFQNVDEL